ncbi:putative ferulic acid esterase protein [Neofusicoccum parvum UCRNP2]|uniref:feruloyl esterase n=1 Tax=Botryosphaeria parva (strain UCR-NP2) TaxID=1287680 RepID=R1EFK4_BOTPV|nr:putative ferulic acid esterase protein [Neofusicoccum parvum UCRNP2]
MIPAPPTLSGAVALLSLALSASAAASDGCGKAPPLSPGTSHSHSIQSGGRTRDYIIHLPAAYDANTAAPLILSFHGNGKNASYQQSLSGFDDAAWNPAGIAVYPQGVGNAWQGAPYADASVSDKAFVGDLLDHLGATYCVDAARVYAAGKSLGGGFCNVLACSPSVSARFAAFAPVSGAFYTGNAADGSDCHPAHAVTPMLEFHGLDDGTIAYGGGEHNGVDLPPILEWAARWAERSGCAEDAEPVVEELYDGNVKHYKWTCSEGNATQHYAIAGLGHDWPSTGPNGDNPDGTYLDATPLIMDFFGKHVNELVK